jgi:hypothetical protein
VLLVPGPGFRGRFWAGFGRKPIANGPNRPKTGPESQVRGPEALLHNLKYENIWAIKEKPATRQKLRDLVPTTDGPGTEVLPYL